MTAGSCLQLAKSGRTAITVGTTRLLDSDPYGQAGKDQMSSPDNVDGSPLHRQVMRKKPVNENDRDEGVVLGDVSSNPTKGVAKRTGRR